MKAGGGIPLQVSVTHSPDGQACCLGDNILRCSAVTDLLLSAQQYECERDVERRRRGGGEAVAVEEGRGHGLGAPQTEASCFFSIMGTTCVSNTRLLQST